MKSLGFSKQLERNGSDGRRVRPARFESRSSLPTSAACIVANGVRETLGSLLGAPVAMRLFEPCIPSPQAWSAILKSARLYRIRGSVADAAIVLRAQDAAALATALFGESSYDAASERALSPIECDVLDRMVGAIAANLGAICGNREGLGVERVAQIGGFVTYFELLVERPAARIGVALSRDPSPEARGSLELEHLAHVELRTLASLDLGTAQASDVGRLGVGTTLAIDGAVFGRCLLSAHGRRIARGSCGVAGGRFAMVVEAMREAM